MSNLAERIFEELWPHAYSGGEEKGIAIIARHTDPLEARLARLEAANPPLTDDQARDVAEMHGGPETDAHIERLREENG